MDCDRTDYDDFVIKTGDNQVIMFSMQDSHVIYFVYGYENYITYMPININDIKNRFKAEMLLVPMDIDVGDIKEISIDEFIDNMTNNMSFIRESKSIWNFVMRNSCDVINQKKSLLESHNLCITTFEQLSQCAYMGSKSFFQEIERMDSNNTKYVSSPIIYIVYGVSPDVLANELYKYNRALSPYLYKINDYENVISSAMAFNNIIIDSYKIQFNEYGSDKMYFSSNSTIKISKLLHLLLTRPYTNFIIDIESNSELNLLTKHFANAGIYNYVYISYDDIDMSNDDFIIKYLSKYNLEDTRYVNQIKDKLKNFDKKYMGAGEVMSVIDNWYKYDYVIDTYFSQYSECINKNVKTNSKITTYSEDKLHKYIGVHDAKNCIDKIKSYYEFMSIANASEIALNINNGYRHMVFTGNPGTAKTSVARLYYEILKENNIIPEHSEFVEVGRADLVGRYVGWTASIVSDKFNLANGGVLFIDEAYSLVDSDNGSYGAEAITTIVQCMENNPRTTVIFAGYPKEMKEFIESNPGLKSRIAFYLNFPDYTLDECVDIFKKFVTDTRMSVSDERVYDFVRNNVSSAMLKENYGNGRYIRNLFNEILINHAQNVCSINRTDVTHSIASEITYEDTIGISNKYIEIDSKSIGFN
jgi:hypothetical protein